MAPNLKFSNKKAGEVKEVVNVAAAPQSAPSSTKKAEGGKSSGSKGPSFVVNTALVSVLVALSVGEIVGQALDKGMDPKWAADTRSFLPSPAFLNGDVPTRTDIRGAVMLYVHPKAKELGDSVPASAIHAFMYLTVDQAYKGKYDVGYVAAAKENAGSRGMISRGYLVAGSPKVVEPIRRGTPAPEQPKDPAPTETAPTEPSEA